jgi:hypothetical protein
MMIGQFDEFGKIGRDENGVENWEKDRDKLAAFRANDKANLGSIVVEPGAGHFAWSDRNAEYLALFMEKAAEARIPATWSIDAGRPIALMDIDPAEGWLSDLDFKHPAALRAAPYAEYRGDKQKAAWHFDRQMAEATIAYHAGIDKRVAIARWCWPANDVPAPLTQNSVQALSNWGEPFLRFPLFFTIYNPSDGANAVANVN